MFFYKILDMNKIKTLDRISIGINGENKILDKLRTKGFALYKRNVKYGYSEIDLILYRLNDKNKIDIRVIEVKTRKKFTSDLMSLGLLNKWSKIRPYLFKIKDDIYDTLGLDNNIYAEMHFDLCIITYSNESYLISSYIEDVNLMI